MGFFGYYVKVRKRKIKRSNLRRRSVQVCNDTSRISGLPDELLIKILSFLPTKAAVSTSILSKRWQSLWMWLSKLEYSRRDCSESGLREFIYKTLPLQRAPVIESLRLSLSSKHVDPEDIQRWIDIAVSRYHVRELYISYRLEYENIFPRSFYTCKSLVSLILRHVALMDLPSRARLPSIKTLRLDGCTYESEESLQWLLDTCPVLEKLSMRFSEDDTGGFTFIVPSLLSLSISIPFFCLLDGYVIDTPSLKYLKLEDSNNLIHDAEIEDMPELREAYVDAVFPINKSVTGSISSVKHLTICSELLKTCRQEDDGFVLNQLEHLKICLCKDDSSDLLGQLLKDSPNLRVLDISYMKDHGDDDFYDMVCWNQEPSPVPECLLSSLQIFKWSRYFGRPQDREIAVYILKNACCLKKATILADTMEHHVPNLKMITELALSSRASSTCQLVFIEDENEVETSVCIRRI